MLVKLFVGERAWSEFEQSLDDGTRSLRDVLQAEAGMVRGTFAEISALLRREIAVEPSFISFAAWCARRSYPLTIVSSGIESIIRDRLDEHGLSHLPVIANEVDPNPNGWSIRFRDDVANGTDKAAIVRVAKAAGKRTVFIGDGRSDYLAAAAADLCFAKRGLPLEKHLRERGTAFEPFSTFDEIERVLTR